ncbi:MAG: hypothetical protein AAB296_03885 [Candidatus Desantisbacteria bacterium]
MMKLMSIVPIGFLLILGLVGNGFAEEAVSNKQILEKLEKMDERINDIDVRVARIEEGLKNCQRQIEDGQKNSQRQIDDIRNLLYVILSGMFALVGFVLWDRRTALVPAVKRMDVLEEREGRLEKILREYAEKEPELAQVMRNVSLTGV